MSIRRRLTGTYVLQFESFRDAGPLRPEANARCRLPPPLPGLTCLTSFGDVSRRPTEACGGCYSVSYSPGTARSNEALATAVNSDDRATSLEVVHAMATS